MISADLPLGGLAMCDLEREVVGNHRAVAAIGPVKGDAVFVSQIFGRHDGQRRIGAGGERSTYCKNSVSRPAN